MVSETAVYPQHFIRYLGTAGTRYVMLSQERASGGIWFSFGGVNGVIDPGPGSLVQITRAFPRLDPMKIDVLLLSHRHIDHSTDMNVLCEAMTNAGHERKGTVLIPSDAIEGQDPVLYQYLIQKIKNNVILRDGQQVDIGKGVTVEPVAHLHHGVECFGFIFRSPHLPTWGIISDTAPILTLPERYRECRFLSVNTTLPLPRARLQHFSIPDVASLLACITPQALLLTHLGRGILNTGAKSAARKLCTKSTRVTAATDGMILDLTSGIITQGGIK